MRDRGPSSAPAARSRRALLALGALAVLAVPALAGCGGGAEQNPPAAAPTAGAPADTTAPNAPAPALPAAPSTDRLATGYRYRFTMTAPPNDNSAVTTREVYLYFRPDTSAVQFQVQNRLGVPIRILWDECSFQDTELRTFKAVHRGTTYQNRL